MYYQGTDLRVGSKIEYKDDVWVVETRQHRTPGKGVACVQTRIRSLITGRTAEVRFNSTEKIKRAILENKQMQYLYKDETGYVFMENETYEQITLKDDDLGDQALYLMDNMEISVQYLKDKPIGIEVPLFVEMEVIETEPGAKGDTVTNVLKPAKFESGLAVQVPLFINQGDVIKIDTRTGEYVTRISKA